MQQNITRFLFQESDFYPQLPLCEAFDLELIFPLTFFFSLIIFSVNLATYILNDTWKDDF